MQTELEFPTQLQDLLGATTVLIAVHDAEDRLQYANDAFRNVFFVEPGENPTWEDMIRRNFAARRGIAINTTNIESWIASVATRRGKVAQRSFESNMVDGKCFWVTETVQNNGWLLLVASDITAISPNERELRLDRDLALKAAQTDDLTGISNRRHIVDMLRQTCAEKNAAPEMFSCACLLDIDHFKNVNDTLGHQAGDDVLVNFTRALRSGIRLKDGFGRVGGEEFLLILKDCSIRSAQHQLARLLARIRKTSLVPALPELVLTVSAGLTDIRLDDSTEAIYGRCDQALYTAKKNGRDRICINIHDRISASIANPQAATRKQDRASSGRAA
jgi:diguanylate cyclase (GGDEF)-like protein